MEHYSPETMCVQAGYQPENGQPRVMPIYQSTTYKYDSADTLGQLFDLKAGGHMYSRISNPSLAFVEEKSRRWRAAWGPCSPHPVRRPICSRF